MKNGIYFYYEKSYKRWGDYERLEDDHSYIQWLFPNFYQSAFNSDAQKLYEHEAEIFRSDPEVNNSFNIELYPTIDCQKPCKVL